MSLENQYQQTLKTKQCPNCGVFVDPSMTVCPNDGTSLVERFDKDPAFVNYEFLGTIGSGGMGVIYKARQVILNKFVAVKTLHPHLSSPAAFRRFQIEGQATSLLKHPFIVSVHDFGITKSGQTFMIMDFIDGETLEQLLRRVGQLDERHFLNIFIDVCDALAHAHGRSVVHRDIKSSNIMIVKGDNGKEEIRIMDFGIAKLVADVESGANQVTKTGEVIGTATCMSPEQARGGKVDHRSDLYALGCVMYESLATSPPFVGNNALETMLMHLEKKPLPIKEASMGNTVDQRIERIIFCLLEKDPDHRYQSMIDLKHDLENLRNSIFSGEKTVEFRMPKKEVQYSKKSWHVPALIGCVAIFLLVGMVIAFLLFRKSPQITDSRAAVLQAEAKSKTISADGNSVGQSTAQAATSESKAGSLMSMPFDENSLKNGFESQLAHGDSTVRMQGAAAAVMSMDLKDEDLAVFRGMHPETRTVDLSFALKVTDKGLANLRDLQLSELRLKDTGASDLDWITNQSELKRLYISNSKLTPRGFKNIGKLKDLQDLEIGQTKFSDADVDSIIGLVNLEKLVITNTQVSVFGYDKLLNTFRKAINIEYSPAFFDKSDYLTGRLCSIDRRPFALILADAQKAMSKSQWRDADVLLERIILRLLGAVHHQSQSQENLQMLVTCEGARGDCLRSMDLPYAAIYMYNLTAKHVHNGNLGDVHVANMDAKVADVLETLPYDASVLDHAISIRDDVEELLRPMIADPHWNELRQKNLESLHRDEIKRASFKKFGR